MTERTNVSSEGGETEPSAPLKSFFVTYGCGTRQSRKFSKVEAKSYEEAYGKVHDAIGEKFSFLYDERQFSGQIEKFGLLEIPLQAHEYWES